MDQALALAAQADQARGAPSALSKFCGEDEDSGEKVNLDFLKWMVSFAWNQGVNCFQREGDRETGKRYFQFS